MRRSGGGFFDGETLDEGVDPVIELRRVLVDGRERFQLLRRIAYRDAPDGAPRDGPVSVGDDGGDMFVIPADPEAFVSDLTSVPAVFTWLVPRSGAHLPAALLHDALVAGPDHYVGRPVDRLEADRIFRDSMAGLGTSLARRWLMWATVVVATIWLGELPRPRWYRGVMVLTLAAVAVLGLVGTVEVVGAASWTGWGDGRPMWERVGIGVAAAVVTPMVLSVLWGRLWAVGMIAGVALALLLHVTVVLVALRVVFAVVESASSRLETRRTRRSRLDPTTGRVAEAVLQPADRGQ